MSDARIQAYAKLIVDRSLDVQPGWQVLIRTSPLARPLLNELVRLIAGRGAYAVVRLGWTMWPLEYIWAEEAPLELLGELPDVDRFACDHMDARITLEAPENTRAGAQLTPERLALVKQAERTFFRRTMSDEIPWVGCQFPTDALAQDAGLTLEQFEEVLYSACLIDWKQISDRMRELLQRFDAADSVRFVAEGTDLTLSLSGRSGDIDDGRVNIPGGEFYFAPVEDSADGVIEFSEFPAVYEGQEFVDIRLVFEDGRIAEASATKGEERLLEILDRDDGARRLGELGIGCNFGITRYMRNTLFDEKIGGTVHLALGQSYEKQGGTNTSAIHWDIVKDLRAGGRIELDGELVQENGDWLI